jgi:hypothetical protein
MLCPTCHRKIGNGDISNDLVIKKKSELVNRIAKIEFVSVVLESRKCNWQNKAGNEFAFFDKWKGKSPYPLLKFTFINHTKKTIVLKSINSKIKTLPSGMLEIGGPFQYGVVKSIARHKIHMIYSEEVNSYQLINPIYAKADSPFSFQLELSEGNDEDRQPIEDRRAVYLSFNFTTGTVRIPTIYFNCTDGNEPVKMPKFKALFSPQNKSSNDSLEDMFLG